MKGTVLEWLLRPSKHKTEEEESVCSEEGSDLDIMETIYENDEDMEEEENDRVHEMLSNIGLSGPPPLSSTVMCTEIEGRFDAFRFIDVMNYAQRTRYTGNGCAVPLVKNACGLEWYSSCNDRANFWDLTVAQRRQKLADGLGRNNLMYSKDWCDSRPVDNKCGIKLLVCNYYMKWIRGDDNNGRRGKRASFKQDRITNARFIQNGDTTRVYALIKTWGQLSHLYRELTLTGRHMEEVIMNSTPHKLYLDVERDVVSHHKVTQAEAISELDGVTRGFENMFLPYLLEFVRSVLGVQSATMYDLTVTYSSREGVKFSAHVVLSTPQTHYFKNRDDSHTAAALMAKFMDKKTSIDRDFKEWYYHDYDKVMVDYSVYGHGQRNMRMIGCCKIKTTLRSDTHWTKARVFVAPPGNEGRPITDYIISVYDAINSPDDYEPLVFSHDQVVEAAQFASQGIGSRLIKRSDALRRRAGVSFMGTTGGLAGNLIAGAMGSLNINDANIDGDDYVLVSLLKKLSPISLGICTKIGHSIAGDPVAWNDYYDIALRILKNVCDGIHPGNSVNAERSTATSAPTWLWRVEMNAFVQGMSRNDGAFRYCYFGCVHGQHRIRIYVMADYSVGYHCHGHRCPIRTSIIMPSPVCHENRVRPGLAAIADYTPEIEAGVLDYNDTPPGPNDDDQHMRELLLQEEMGLANNEKVTYLLHGGMGTGKTTAVAALIEKCRGMRTEPRILSISFRVMLAKNASETLGIDYYKTAVSRSLYDNDALALQLDSVERLLQVCNNTDDLSKLRCGHDILVLDELCSLLSHLGSSTLKNKLNNVWHVFFRLVRSAGILVCCDADMGAREQRFLRMTRGSQNDDGSWRIPNLVYHRNHYVGIKTTFVEYKGEFEWAENILKCAIDDRMNCFVVSNSINQIERLKEWLEERVRAFRLLLDEQIRKDGGDPEKNEQIEYLDELATQIDIITSRSTETEKNKMSDSNRNWIKSKILIISPTVGAGVDFNEEHFDVAFVYATNKSCCARAINQMRGRARSILTKTCHVFINSLSKCETENDGVLPLTPALAMEKLRHYRSAYVLQPLEEDGAADEDGFFYFTRSLIPDRLMEIQAHNMAETNRSVVDLRMEWIKLQQACDPDLEYRFEDSFDPKKNYEFIHTMNDLRTVIHDKRVKQVSNQRDIDLQEYNNAKSMDKMARMGDIEPSQARASVMMEKNEIRHFYGIKDDVSPDDFSRIMKKLDTTLPGREKIDNAVRVLFLENDELVALAKRENLINPSTISVTERGCGAPHLVNSGSRMAQESEVTDFEKRKWLQTLMYACGGNLENIKVDIFSAFEFHTGLAVQRLDEDDHVQKWLREQSVRADMVGIEGKDCAPTDGRFEWKHVYMMLKKFFSKHFDIQITMPYNNKKKGEDRSEGRCREPEHKFKVTNEETNKTKSVMCTKAVANRDDVELLLEKAFARASSRTFTVGGEERNKLVGRIEASFPNKKYNSDFMNLIEMDLPTRKNVADIISPSDVAQLNMVQEVIETTTVDQDNQDGGQGYGGYGYGGYGYGTLDADPPEEPPVEFMESGSTTGGSTGSSTDSMVSGSTGTQSKKRKLSDIDAMPDRRKRKADLTKDVHAKNAITQRMDLWDQMKVQYIQENPADMDGVSFRNLMLTRTYKVITKGTINKMSKTHMERLVEYVQKNSSEIS